MSEQGSVSGVTTGGLTPSDVFVTNPQSMNTVVFAWRARALEIRLEVEQGDRDAVREPVARERDLAFDAVQERGAGSGRASLRRPGAAGGSPPVGLRVQQRTTWAGPIPPVSGTLRTVNKVFQLLVCANRR